MRQGPLFRPVSAKILWFGPLSYVLTTSPNIPDNIGGPGLVHKSWTLVGPLGLYSGDYKETKNMKFFEINPGMPKHV